MNLPVTCWEQAFGLASCRERGQQTPDTGDAHLFLLEAAAVQARALVQLLALLTALPDVLPAPCKQFRGFASKVALQCRACEVRMSVLLIGSDSRPCAISKWPKLQISGLVRSPVGG